MANKHSVPFIHSSLRGRFSQTAIAVLWNLLSRMKVGSEAPQCSPHITTLEKDTRLSKPTILRGLKELKAEGIITVVRGGIASTGKPTKGNTYKLVLSCFPESTVQSRYTGTKPTSTKQPTHTKQTKGNSDAVNRHLTIKRAALKKGELLYYTDNILAGNYTDCTLELARDCGLDVDSLLAQHKANVTQEQQQPTLKLPKDSENEQEHQECKNHEHKERKLGHRHHQNTR